MAEQLGLGLGRLRKPLLENGGNPRMKLLAAAPEQAPIGHLVHERVLEAVGRVRRRAAAEHELRGVFERNIKKALWRTTGPQVSGRNIQPARFQVWPPQNMPPKAQPWTLSKSLPFSAIVKS